MTSLQVNIKRKLSDSLCFHFMCIEAVGLVEIKLELESCLYCIDTYDDDCTKLVLVSSGFSNKS